ncbi:unnamed protein product [Symbiodinium microadriaticum]|nr:unnamed protein product [Symbiodinium sp. KB8]CAE7525825.1 unnamed protein product [Symbiodinium microadriaticum]
MPRWVKLLILADLKEQVTSPEKWQAKPVPLSDRQNRLAFLKKKLSGIIIAGPSEPSHALLDEATRMEREGTLRYIPAERCQTRLYEIQNTKTSSGSKVLELLEGKLAVKEDSPLGDITCSSVLLFQEALRRRGLALEFAGVGTYLEHERYIHKLFSYMGRDPPPDCQRTTVAQLMAADKALWTRMVEQGVSPQRSIEGSFPLDAALVPTLETYEVTIHLLPRSAEEYAKSSVSSQSCLLLIVLVTDVPLLQAPPELQHLLPAPAGTPVLGDALQRDVTCVVENPTKSLFWKTSAWQSVKDAFHFVTCEACAFGGRKVVPAGCLLLRFTPLSPSLPEKVELAWGVPWSEAEFVQEASQAKRPRKVLKSVVSQGDLDKVVMEKTLVEKDEGWLVGPLDHSEVEPFALISRRFGLSQGDKVRLIDNMTSSGVNLAVQAYEAPQPQSPDVFASILHRLMQTSPRLKILGRAFDLSAAYRQLAIDPSTAWAAYVSCFDAERGEPVVFRMRALPFGSAMAVYSFLRAALAIWLLGVKELWLPWSDFFDDYVTFACSHSAGQVEHVVALYFKILGWRHASRDFAELFVALGIQVDLGTFLQGQNFFCNTDKRIAELKCSIQSFLDEGMLLFSEALKLRGQQQFEDLRDGPGEDIAEDVPVEEEVEEGPSYGLQDGPQPLSSIFEEEEEGETPAARGRSRSPPPVTTARSRRVSVAEPDTERTPSHRISSAELLDDVPASIRSRLEERRVEEEANVSIRKKLMGFWSSRLSTKEQVERDLKELPESLKYWECTPSVRQHIDGSRAKEWKKYEDFQAAIPIMGARLKALLDAGHVPIPSKWVDIIKNFHERLKPDYSPEFKSRLVSCGNFEDSTKVRRCFSSEYQYMDSVIAVAGFGGGKVVCVLTTHVDDFLWVGRRESGRLRLCGKQFDKSGSTLIRLIAVRNPAIGSALRWPNFMNFMVSVHVDPIGSNWRERKFRMYAYRTVAAGQTISIQRQSIFTEDGNRTFEIYFTGGQSWCFSEEKQIYLGEDVLWIKVLTCLLQREEQ